MSRNRFDLPDLGLGVGLRTAHFAHVLGERPAVGFFEAITENFLDTGGRPAFILDQVAERYPIVLHGVSLSIGSTDPLDFGYLRKVARLARRTRAAWVSDHVCWTGVQGRNTHDLLPLPYTREALAHVVDRLRRVQDVLGQRILLENVSSYLAWRQSEMTEWEFLAELVRRTDCDLLLDVNNVYVSAHNHGFDPHAYVDAIPADHVAQIHLAGHSDHGTHLLDTHDAHVADAVWDLYRHTIARLGPVSTLIEWDGDVPPLDVVEDEAARARRAAGDARAAKGARDGGDDAAAA